MSRTARSPPIEAAARPGGEFFARPSGPNHRRYEALRAYLWEGTSAEEAAARAGYSTAEELSGCSSATSTTTIHFARVNSFNMSPH